MFKDLAMGDYKRYYGDMRKHGWRLDKYDAATLKRLDGHFACYC